jgi:hypothetical protein
MPDPSPNSATLSVPVLRDFQPVYEFASNPLNLPRWAPGLCNNIRPDGAEWVIDTPDGGVRVTFAGKNAFGVLDHWVHPAPGVEIYVPMRVVAAPHGSEVLFTVFRLPGMSDEEFAADQKMVLADLRRLKNLLEAPGAA